MHESMQQHAPGEADKDVLSGLDRDLLADFDRAYEVFSEVVSCFRQLHDLGPAVTIYGSARLGEGHPYYELTRATAAELVRAGYAVITGGGPGLMEAANRGAKEAGGESLGFNILLPHEQGLNPYVDRQLTFEYFFIRKLMLRRYSQGFVLMPGGLGSLDEIFETGTLIQTGKLARFPLVRMGRDYWDPIADAIRSVTEAAGTVGAGEIEMLATDSPAEAVKYLVEHAPPLPRTEPG